ncbi:sigma-70 family RNA polymerase sigma factor [Inediibacterium massiliense]|uniref:sigma-70 family RNA polymerase sigma factor n=1 Tax=Inediibacterium massiliense TaxID=1658111 RepID=UPI0006B5909A|nr:sigma-70 family RNA polymerase sigma factor [Inediibacterium massiliense]
MNNIDDLVRICKKEDESMKEEILKRLRPLVIASMKRYFYDAKNFSDLLQDGYIKILECMDDFDEERKVHFLGYVKIQLKYFYMEKRRKRVYDISLNTPIGEGEDELLDLLKDEDMNIEKELLETEQCMRLKDALKALSPKQKKVMIYYYGKGMNMKKIAKLEGVHYQSIVKIKNRAIKKLKEKF